MKNKLIKGLLYILGALAIGYIIINTNWKEVWFHISSISPKIMILLLLFQCITLLLLSIQWRAMALRVKKDVAFLDVLMVNVKGNIVDAITPGVKTGGELARVYELKKRLNIELGDATIIIGLQKTISLFSFLLLTLFSLICFSFSIGKQYRSYLYIFSLVIGIFAIVLAILIIFSFKPNMMIKMLNKALGKYKFMDKVEKTLLDYSTIIKGLLKDKKKFTLQLLLAIFIWLFYAFKLLFVMKGFAVEIDYISIAAITFLSYIIGMLPLLPGSIGSFEGSMLLLLAIKGVPIEIGLSISFVFRFVTFWFEFLISFIILLLNNIILFLKKGEKSVGIKAR